MPTPAQQQTIDALFAELNIPSFYGGSAGVFYDGLLARFGSEAAAIGGLRNHAISHGWPQTATVDPDTVLVDASGNVSDVVNAGDTSAFNRPTTFSGFQGAVLPLIQDAANIFDPTIYGSAPSVAFGALGGIPASVASNADLQAWWTNTFLPRVEQIRATQVVTTDDTTGGHAERAESGLPDGTGIIDLTPGQFNFPSGPELAAQITPQSIGLDVGKFQLPTAPQFAGQVPDKSIEIGPQKFNLPTAGELLDAKGLGSFQIGPGQFNIQPHTAQGIVDKLGDVNVPTSSFKVPDSNQLLGTINNDIASVNTALQNLQVPGSFQNDLSGLQPQIDALSFQGPQADLNRLSGGLSGLPQQIQGLQQDINDLSFQRPQSGIAGLGQGIGQLQTGLEGLKLPTNLQDQIGGVQDALAGINQQKFGNVEGQLTALQNQVKDLTTKIDTLPTPTVDTSGAEMALSQLPTNIRPTVDPTALAAVQQQLGQIPRSISPVVDPTALAGVRQQLGQIPTQFTPSVDIGPALGQLAPLDQQLSQLAIPSLDVGGALGALSPLEQRLSQLSVPNIDIAQGLGALAPLETRLAQLGVPDFGPGVNTALQALSPLDATLGRINAGIADVGNIPGINIDGLLPDNLLGLPGQLDTLGGDLMGRLGNIDQGLMGLAQNFPLTSPEFPAPDMTTIEEGIQELLARGATGGPPITSDGSGDNLNPTGGTNTFFDALQASILESLERGSALPTAEELRADPITASILADLQSRREREEAQLREDLNRMGLLQTGTEDTGRALGTLRGEFNRAETRALADAALRVQDLLTGSQTRGTDLGRALTARETEMANLLGILDGQPTMERDRLTMDILGAVTSLFDPNLKFDQTPSTTQTDLARQLLQLSNLDPATINRIMNAFVNAG